MTLATERQQFAEQNEMSLDFVNWFFDEKKESFGNMWFLMAAALWEGWKGRDNREAQPVAVTDEMALAFHRALNDGGIGESDLEEIKVGLRGALCNITAPPAPAVPEEMTGGIAMSKYKVKKSNYVQWVKGWNACRAAMLAQPVNSGEK